MGRERVLTTSREVPGVYLEGMNLSAARSTPNKLLLGMKGSSGVGTETDNYSFIPQDDREIL